MEEQLSAGLQGQIARLILADVERQLPGQGVQTWRFDAEIEDFFPDAGVALMTSEIFEMISAASCLALSPLADDRTWAFEIITRALRVDRGRTPAIRSAAEMVLSRLGNFPGRKLLRDEYGVGEDDSGLSPYLSLEVVAREIDNTVDLPSGRALALTDFQYDLFEEMGNWPAASISAPTSAGKSFVLTLDVARRIRSSKRFSSIVYVVPTRALIRQVMLDVIHELDRESMTDVAVRCVPIPLQPSSSRRAVVYVLTQERLVSLLQSDEGEPDVTTLIVDEAQGIGDGSRGIILHSATDAVLARFPKCRTYFASPTSSNPGYLLQIFHRERAAPPLIEEHSPVSQNIILVHPKKGDPERVDFWVLVNRRSVYLGEWALGFRFGGEPVLLRRARIAVAITRSGESTIVYANEPSQAEALAALVSEMLVEKHSNEPIPTAIQEVASFLRDHIHPDYGLIKVLERGVGFHYGAMPSVVRYAVEELFSGGHLRFICCTSTLLQGVNLPAKHIVIENPSRGRGRHMSRRDFVNLAGRAGRLCKEFQGNVWCLCPEAWEVKSYRGDVLQPITSSFEETLSDGGSLITQAIDGTVPPDKVELATAALGKVFAEFTQAGKSLADSQYRTDSNAEGLRQTAERCAAIKVDLPPRIFERNATILPMRLQALYEYLRNQPDLMQWTPLPVHNSGSQVRLKLIFQTVEQILEERPPEDEGYTLCAWLAGEWIREVSLKDIIEERRRWLVNNDRDAEIDKVIADIMGILENDLRYRYTRNLRAYSEILAVVLDDVGLHEAADHLVPLQLFLECGASNPITISLISLGLSRTTALLIRKRLPFPVNANPEECLAIIAASDDSRWNIPAICAAEIKSLCWSPVRRAEAQRARP
ncbi:MAG TPA: DEAD/DEAH box helicase [Tepidisphaeraceae bacterium]|nr:DEAD/DEAH box helicase [Tepidisphaeraceae bacterium]